MIINKVHEKCVKLILHRDVDRNQKSYEAGRAHFRVESLQDCSYSYSSSGIGMDPLGGSWLNAPPSSL